VVIMRSAVSMCPLLEPGCRQGAARTFRFSFLIERGGRSPRVGIDLNHGVDSRTTLVDLLIRCRYFSVIDSEVNLPERMPSCSCVMVNSSSSKGLSAELAGAVKLPGSAAV